MSSKIPTQHFHAWPRSWHPSSSFLIRCLALTRPYEGGLLKTNTFWSASYEPYEPDEPTYDDEEPIEPQDPDDVENPDGSTRQNGHLEDDIQNSAHDDPDALRPNGVNGVNGERTVVTGDPNAGGTKKNAVVGLREKKIMDDKRSTTPYMTKYERARVLGTRALQIRYA